MKRAIFRKFVWIILLALLASSLVFCLIMGRKNRSSVEDQLFDTLYMMDYSLDYSGDLEKQLQEICSLEGNEHTRATVLSAEGRVLADNGVPDDEQEQLESHLGREEVQQALKEGKGIAERYSSTLHKRLLYAAILTERG